MPEGGKIAGSVTLAEAMRELPRLIEQVRGGDEVVITEAGRSIARLVGAAASASPAFAAARGALRGQIWLGPDWDKDDYDAEERRAFGID